MRVNRFEEQEQDSRELFTHVLGNSECIIVGTLLINNNARNHLGADASQQFILALHRNGLNPRLRHQAVEELGERRVIRREHQASWSR